MPLLVCLGNIVPYPLGEKIKTELIRFEKWDGRRLGVNAAVVILFLRILQP
jgi:hypothetical protein